ncbi:unnamed protein product [Brassica oleracea]
MSVSTRSLTASPSKRTPIVAGQNKSKFVSHSSESLANGEACGASRNLILSEAVID